MLIQSRDQLAPHLSLQAVDASAGRIVGSISVAAALVSALGVLGATEVADVGWGWALPSVLLAAASAALSIWATVPVFSYVRPGDLEDVDRFFTHQIKWRGGLVRAAGLAFGLALLLTPLPLLAATVRGEHPAVDVTAVRRGDQLVTAVAAKHADENATIELTADTDPPLRLLELQVDRDGTATGTASVPLKRVAGAQRLLVTTRAADGETTTAAMPVPGR